MKILDLRQEDFDPETQRIIGFRAWLYATKEFTHIRITMDDKYVTFRVAEVIKGAGKADYELVVGAVDYIEEFPSDHKEKVAP